MLEQRRGQVRRHLGWLAKDMAALMRLTAGGLVSRVLPPRFDGRLTIALGNVAARIQPGRLEEMAVGMAEALPSATGVDWSRVAADRRRIFVEELWARSVSVWPHRWQPDISVGGLANLQEARAANNGVILWRTSGVGTLVTPIGLWRAGVPVVHLSAQFHGSASPGWISRHIVSRWIVRGENAYLAERVVIPTDRSRQYLRVLVERLQAGAVVSIIGDVDAQTPITACVAGMSLSFATGTPSLARLTGCAVLPVFESWKGPQTYRVDIQEPIVIDRSHSRQALAQEAIEEFASRLDAWLALHPASWRRWHHVVPREGR